jgi:predicted dehydrogenase
MPNNESLTRREFLGKTTLLATAAGVAAGATKARAQINNGAVPPPKRVGVGFIGVGIRGTLLMEAAAGIYGADIVGVCDLYKGHLDRAREAFGDKLMTTGDYQQLLARSDIDAVIIAAPDHWHLKMAQDAMQAGKNVYIEKPMTHSWEEGAEFIKAVDKSKKVLQVGSQYMSMGCAQKAMDLIKSGRLGQITLVEGKIYRNSSTGAWYYPIPPDASPQTIDWKSFIGGAPWHEFDTKRFFQWRLFWDYSGGLPTDLFVHLITATHQLMGVQEPESVASFGGIFRWKNYREVPDQMAAIVNYSEGFQLRLTSTANNSHPGPALTFCGTEGTLEYDGDSFKYYFEPRRENFEYPTHSWPRATVKQYNQIMNINEKESPLLDVPATSDAPVAFSNPDAEESTRAHIRNFIDAVRNGTAPIEDVRFGANAALVGHMCNLSYRNGKIARWNKKTKQVEI